MRDWICPSFSGHAGFSSFKSFAYIQRWKTRVVSSRYNFFFFWIFHLVFIISPSLSIRCLILKAEETHTLSLQKKDLNVLWNVFFLKILYSLSSLPLSQRCNNRAKEHPWDFRCWIWDEIHCAQFVCHHHHYHHLHHHHHDHPENLCHQQIFVKSKP